MKADILVGLLCLAPLALAAPHSGHTVRVAPKSTWTPPDQQAPAVMLHTEDSQHVVVSKETRPMVKATTSQKAAFKRPMATKYLQPPLPKAQTGPPMRKVTDWLKPKPSKGGARKVSVGTLVVPGGHADSVFTSLSDPENSPYLIPGQYIPRQRADLLFVGGVVLCALVIVMMERWASLASFLPRLVSRERGIQLRGSGDLEVSQASMEEDSDQDMDNSNASFAGYKQHMERTGFMLPVTVDEKAGWI